MFPQIPQILNYSDLHQILKKVQVMVERTEVLWEVIYNNIFKKVDHM